jgi:hypothetical protein
MHETLDLGIDSSNTTKGEIMIYHGLWAESKLKGMCGDFNIDEVRLKGAKVLFASYEYEDYSGYALVLYSQNEKLYEVNGSHCSCYGLEGQWEPEETNVSALKLRTISTPGADDFAKVLKKLEKEERS